MDKVAEELETAAQQNYKKTLYNITTSPVICKVGELIPTSQCAEATAPSSARHQTSSTNGRMVEQLAQLHISCQPTRDRWDDLDINLGPITKAKVVEAIQKIGIKAPGLDNIPPEVMIVDTGVTENIMINLLQDVWEKEKCQWDGRQWVLLRTVVGNERWNYS